MKRSRGKQLLWTIGLTGCMMLLGWLSPGLGAATNPKVDVCHRSLNGSFNLISVAYQAVQAHRQHGDALPGEAVPGMPGYKFDDTCTPVRASICPCDFSMAGLAALDIDGRQTETLGCSLDEGAPDLFAQDTVTRKSAFAEAIPANHTGTGQPACNGSNFGNSIFIGVGNITDTQFTACINDLLAAAAKLGVSCQ